MNELELELDDAEVARMTPLDDEEARMTPLAGFEDPDVTGDRPVVLLDRAKKADPAAGGESYVDDLMRRLEQADDD